jgi:hypothetical protein
MMTECERIRAAILESFDESGGVMRRPDVARHVRGCSSCQAFARRHDELDTQLATSLSPPSLGTAFRASLRRQIGRDMTSKWHERLPDIMHISGCGAVVMIYATLVPADLPMTVLVGMTGTLGTYAVMSMARAWFEDVDCS